MIVFDPNVLWSVAALLIIIIIASAFLGALLRRK